MFLSEPPKCIQYIAIYILSCRVHSIYFDIFCLAERLRHMTCRLTSNISTKEFHHYYSQYIITDTSFHISERGKWKEKKVKVGFIKVRVSISAVGERESCRRRLKMVQESTILHFSLKWKTVTFTSWKFDEANAMQTIQHIDRWNKSCSFEGCATRLLYRVSWVWFLRNIEKVLFNGSPPWLWRLPDFL